MDKAELRAAIAGMEQSIGATGDEPTRNALRASFATVVELLRLPPAPETRVCPTCQKTVMRAATVCGHCWTKLSVAP